jgi:hypothetical protein
MMVARPSGKGGLRAGNITGSKNFASEPAPRERELLFGNFRHMSKSY